MTATASINSRNEANSENRFKIKKEIVIKDEAPCIYEATRALVQLYWQSLPNAVGYPYFETKPPVKMYFKC